VKYSGTFGRREEGQRAGHGLGDVVVVMELEHHAVSPESVPVMLPDAVPQTYEQVMLVPDLVIVKVPELPSAFFISG
jgi:hypothetical protein